MGWAERDYAKWTYEERERFYGSHVRGLGPGSTGGVVFRRGVGPAVLVSGLLFALGHFPAGHPLVPLLGISFPGLPGVRASTPSTATISAPATTPLGSTLTFRGTGPPGNALVTVDGSYDGGQTWQTLSRVGSVDGTYAAQITPDRRGLLQIRIVFGDGSTAFGSTVVE